MCVFTYTHVYILTMISRKVTANIMPTGGIHSVALSSRQVSGGTSCPNSYRSRSGAAWRKYNLVINEGITIII